MQLIERIEQGLLEVDELLEYVTDNDVDIAIAVAKAPNVTEPILNIASHDKDVLVRKAVANNPNTTKKVLEYLLSDKDTEIVETAKRRLEEMRV